MTEIKTLRERAKELRCLYSIDAILSDRQQRPLIAFERILSAIPSGWQHAESTATRIEYLGKTYSGLGFRADTQMMSESLRLWDTEIGHISVSDSREDAVFLPEEEELLQRIASRLGEYLEWKHAQLLGEGAAAGKTHWLWRQRFAEALARCIDPERFAVSAVLLGGSTARGDSGPGSDIDLYIRLDHASEETKKKLALWLEGWSLCLAEVALQQTGYRFRRGILNVHWLEADPPRWQRPELIELALGTPGESR